MPGSQVNKRGRWMEGYGVYETEKEGYPAHKRGTVGKRGHPKVQQNRKAGQIGDQTDSRPVVGAGKLR